VDNHGPESGSRIDANGFALLSNHYQAVKAAKALFEEDVF